MREHWGDGMRELVRTNNAVVISAIGALLDAAKIPHVVLDQNMSVLEGLDRHPAAARARCRRSCCRRPQAP